MKLRVRRLLPGDDRAAFESGNVDLDRFFQRYAGQNQFRHHIGTTYVAVDADDAIAGYATVTASELTREALSERPRHRLPPYPVPVLRLARLAVARRVQGRGVGADLLQAVFILALRMAEEFGCLGVVVDAKPEAVGYYEKMGFQRLAVLSGELGDRPMPIAMFIELAAVAAALKQ